MPDVEQIAAAYEEILRRIVDACDRAGRAPESVTVIGVTKTKPVDVVRAAFHAGILDLGENYAQELIEKEKIVTEPVRWHFIGHLQRNKVKAIASFVHMIHGVDSERLAGEIDHQAGAVDRRIPVLLQINTSGEESKYGAAPADAVTLAQAIVSLPNIELRGLMTLAAYLDNPEATRPMFRLLRTIRDELRDATGLRLDDLSMGMTNDYEVAVEEGATMVRIGTALFGERAKG